ncbi:MAG: HEPN/Toprim-associated domain-containing protein [Acetobacteraceae bacterium]
MGSYCALYFDEIFIGTQKSYVPDEFVYLFQESDRVELPPKGEDEFSEPRVVYKASRAVILNRLDVGGFTAENSANAFEAWLAEERETWKSYAAEGWLSNADATAAALSTFSYAEWKVRARKVLLSKPVLLSKAPRDEIDRHMREEDEDGWLLFDDDYLICLRAMLESFPEAREVILDIGDLIGGGWIEEDEGICETRRASNAQRRSILEPAVIITEGSTDIQILRRSLERLFPHLVEYTTFFDYEGLRPDGGANWIVKFLRAFAAARINTLVLAVFDNDAAGEEAFRAASSLKLPDNIRVTKLPNIGLAEAYPTVGPQGLHDMDVNGRAVSIEMFLGRQNLTNADGRLMPVVWNNYVQSVQQYQGAISDKRAVLEKFLRETEAHDETVDYQTSYPELVQLWKHLFLQVQLVSPSRFISRIGLTAFR